MGRTLVIAEKPSVARELAKALGASRRGQGCLESDAHVVTWAVGHLVNIAEPELQDPRWKGRWSLSQLPMIPAKFLLDVLPGTKDQFETVARLLAAEDVTDVVNATDAGREGELIFRRIYKKAGSVKPIRRLWANDMTEEGLKHALANLLPGDDKRNLGLAAFARAEADWLIGMNFSRLFTVKVGDLITVGRVQTPVLKLLVDRLRDIEGFVPKDYWTIEGTFRSGEAAFTAVWQAPPDYKEEDVAVEADALAVAGRCRGAPASVLEIVSKKGSQKPPLPYDLTTLQREANSHHGFSAQKTLTLAQSLYEQKKVLTYPRTDSRHLTTELFKEILKYFRAIYAHYPELSKEAADRIKDAKKKFACVDDKQVSDHHAIIPTAQPAKREALTDDEWKIYDMVSRRFIAAFLPEATFLGSTVWVEVAGERFKATGKIFQDRGWLRAEPWRAAKDNPLPDLKAKAPLTVDGVEPVKHKTKPPAHYTEAALLGVMETAGKLVQDEELRLAMKERGLGTPATRASIIETVVARGFVEKKEKSLIATEKGCFAIDVVGGLLPEVVSPELTGDWERKLKEMEGGRLTYQVFMQQIRGMVRAGVATVRPKNVPRRPAPFKQAPAAPAAGSPAAAPTSGPSPSSVPSPAPAKPKRAPRAAKPAAKPAPAAPPKGPSN